MSWDLKVSLLQTDSEGIRLGEGICRQQGSNPRLPVYKTGALPTELYRQRGALLYPACPDQGTFEAAAAPATFVRKGVVEPGADGTGAASGGACAGQEVTSR
jgi:hypothetical protein